MAVASGEMRSGLRVLARGTPYAFERRLFTRLSSPRPKGISEVFIKPFKRDYAQSRALPGAETVMALQPAWFGDCNEIHPHWDLKFVPRKSPFAPALDPNELAAWPGAAQSRLRQLLASERKVSRAVMLSNRFWEDNL